MTVFIWSQVLNCCNFALWHKFQACQESNDPFIFHSIGILERNSNIGLQSGDGKFGFQVRFHYSMHACVKTKRHSG